jgi:putative transcriptional regulator
MSLAHHPSEELLLDFAAGRLERGPALVVQAHLQACPVCRAETGRFEAVGGALLGALPHAALAEDALAQALARLDAPPPTPPPTDKIRQGLPDMLVDESFGPRRWLAPGLWLRLRKREPGARFTTYLLHSAPRRRLPRHSHEGAEYVCVLDGAFADKTGRYGAGDFACGDDELEHAPRAEPGGVCLCLIATEGRLKMRSAIAQAIQLYAGV